jgi:cystathionine beta-lyase
MKYDFDAILNRRGTGSLKWDRNKKFENVSGREDINSMWVADMDFPCAEPIVRAMVERAAHPVYGYTYFDGSDFHKIVAKWNLSQYSRTVDPDDILYAPGVVFAIACALNAYSDPGDGVIIQTPVYYPFRKMITNNGRALVENPLVNNDGHYAMDYEDLALKASQPEVKLLILCSPHNPVGRVWTKDELKRVSDICRDNGVLLMSDEIHGDLIRAGQEFITAATVGYPENTVTFNAPSKTFNIPGLMASWVIIENEKLKKAWMDEAYGKTGMSLPNPFGLTATIAAYEESLYWLKQVNEYIDGNLLFIKEFIDEHMPAVKYEIPEGTYLAWLDFRETCYPDDEELSNIMDGKLGILVDPGIIFGAPGKGFIRINAACPRSRLEDALAKISSLV